MCYKNEDMNKCNIIDIYYTLYRFMAENQHQEHTSSNLASSGLKKFRRQKERVPVGI